MVANKPSLVSCLVSVGPTRAPPGPWSGPEVDRNGPKVDRNAPKVDRSGPKVDRNGPKVDRNGPEVDRNGPKVDRNGPTGGFKGGARLMVQKGDSVCCQQTEFSGFSGPPKRSALSTS